MQLFQVIAILLTLAALCAYVNHRYLRLHPSIGIMLVALVLSLILIATGEFAMPVQRMARAFLSNIHFDDAVLHWMLGFLLFAGAMSVDLNELMRNRGVTAVLTVVGTIASMFIVGGLTWAMFKLLASPMPVHVCLLFGALISPTDPVAVISLMKNVGASRSIQTVISAESLFNDGIGVVLFLTLLEFARGTTPVTVGSVTWLFLRESLGGALIGLAGGAVVYLLLRRVDEYQVEVLLTLALVMGTYALAEGLRCSAPIATVVAGLLMGNQGRVFNLPVAVGEDLGRFWNLIEEILNAVLFLLIGMQVLVTRFNRPILIATAFTIPVVLLARWLSVTATIRSMPAGRSFKRALIPILTWGGLRGGLAVAMALSLPQGPYRDAIVSITYGVVVFSILVQGTTIRRVIKRSLTHDDTAIAAA